LTEKIMKVLSDRFSYNLMIILIPSRILNQIVTAAPEDFGKNPEKYRYDVIFFSNSFKPEDLIKELKPLPGVDEVYSGDYTLYFRRLITRASQSRLTKLSGMPVYKYLSVRNWNTTLKLHELINS